MQPSKNQTGKYLFSLLFLFCISYFYGQEAILSSGKSITSDGGSVSFSIGQINTMTSSSENYLIIEGVQQTFDAMPTSISDTPIHNELITIYPNPTKDIIQIKTDVPNTFFTQIKIYNSEGSLIESIKTKKAIYKLNISSLPSGIYYIQTKTNQNYLSSHKLIKTNN